MRFLISNQVYIEVKNKPLLQNYDFPKLLVGVIMKIMIILPAVAISRACNRAIANRWAEFLAKQHDDTISVE